MTTTLVLLAVIAYGIVGLAVVALMRAAGRADRWRRSGTPEPGSHQAKDEQPPDAQPAQDKSPAPTAPSPRDQ